MFSQTAEYALRAMVYLAENDGTPCGSERISVATQVPKAYLSKIMRDLVVANLVTSSRGPNGGFVMTAKPLHVAVLDVVNAVDPIKRITTCPLGRPNHQTLCPLHRQMDAAIEHVESSLRATFLSELVTSGTFNPGSAFGTSSGKRKSKSRESTPPKAAKSRP